MRPLPDHTWCQLAVCTHPPGIHIDQGAGTGETLPRHLLDIIINIFIAEIIRYIKLRTFNILEGLAPYGGQTSCSCGELVAFCHQIGALRPPWLVKLKFGALCAPPSSSSGGLMAFVHLIWAMFVYGF